MSDFTQAVQLAHHCVLFLVDADASRREVEDAIDHSPKLKRGMSFAVRAAVLEKFEADSDPVPNVDYLRPWIPCLKPVDSQAWCGETVGHIGPCIAEPVEVTDARCPGCGGLDGEHVSRDCNRRPVATMETAPAEFLSEHGAAVAR